MNFPFYGSHKWLLLRKLTKKHPCKNWLMVRTQPYLRQPLRAAINFGRLVHFAVRRKMRKPPITRVTAILNGLTNRQRWKTDSIYAHIVSDDRHCHEWLQFRSIQSSNEENGRSSQFPHVSECIPVFRVIRCLKVGTYLSSKGITYLLTLWTVNSYILYQVHDAGQLVKAWYSSFSL